MPTRQCAANETVFAASSTHQWAGSVRLVGSTLKASLPSYRNPLVEDGGQATVPFWRYLTAITGVNAILLGELRAAEIEIALANQRALALEAGLAQARENILVIKSILQSSVIKGWEGIAP